MAFGDVSSIKREITDIKHQPKKEGEPSAESKNTDLSIHEKDYKLTFNKTGSIPTNSASSTVENNSLFDTKIKSHVQKPKDISQVIAGNSTTTKDYNYNLYNINKTSKADNKNPSFGTIVKAMGYTITHRKGIDDADPSFKKLSPEVQDYIRQIASGCSANA